MPGNLNEPCCSVHDNNGRESSSEVTLQLLFLRLAEARHITCAVALIWAGEEVAITSCPLLCHHKVKLMVATHKMS